MTFVRRAATVLATALLTVGLIGVAPADAARDSGGSSARDTSWGY